ncbi:hypothetical protein [Halorubellus sp. PRR65]|uniref:hypothetical protein n=1 Tax=Halorubellus sp. PRR65 TaxID=3098148 RepID=UPI002B25E7A6|nr:hypothetical protein [Halorubellus sp. PRR65]
MEERVDVVAFDEPASRSTAERKHRQTVAFATYTVVAVVLGAALVQGMLLLGVLGAVGVLGVWHLLFRDDRPMTTTYRAVEAGRGAEILHAHETEARKRDQMRTFVVAGVVAVVAGWGFIQGSLLLSLLGGGAVAAFAYVVDDEPLLPRVVETDIERERADSLFEIVDGTTTDDDERGR